MSRLLLLLVALFGGRMANADTSPPSATATTKTEDGVILKSIARLCDVVQHSNDEKTTLEQTGRDLRVVTTRLDHSQRVIRVFRLTPDLPGIREIRIAPLDRKLPGGIPSIILTIDDRFRLTLGLLRGFATALDGDELPDFFEGRPARIRSELLFVKYAVGASRSCEIRAKFAPTTAESDDLRVDRIVLEAAPPER